VVTVLAAVALAALVTSASTGPAGASGGPQTTPIATDARSVPDVEAQFRALALRPDALGFHLDGSPSPSKCQHYQGIARKDAADGTPYLFITKSGNVPTGCTGTNVPGSLLIVKMGSRDKNGERLRSNKLRRNWEVDGPSGPPPPDERDEVVSWISFHGDATWPEYGGTGPFPAYGHPGGMQVVGDVLAVALESPYEGAAEAAILFLDVSDPETPRFLSVTPLLDAPTDDFGSGDVGIAPVRTAAGGCCRYLMVVTGKSNADLRFYYSQPTDGTLDGATDLTSSNLSWLETVRYSESQLEAGACLDDRDWPTGFGFLTEGHQTLNFVRQGGIDGPLYLVGARNDVPGGFGEDRIDLYRMNLRTNCPFEHVRELKVTSYPAGGFPDSANFAAGSGVYVSPSGELIFYATDYAGDSALITPTTAPIVEYRHRDVVRPESPTLHPTAAVGGPFAVDEGSTANLTGTGEAAITKAWLSLYEDSGAAGTSIPGTISSIYDSDWWLQIDYPDREAAKFSLLDSLDHDTALGSELDFEENAEAWRWWAPPGCTISANDFPIDSGSWPGPTSVLLRGTGSVEVATNLGNLPVYPSGYPDPPSFASPIPPGTSSGGLDFGDDIEGVTFHHRGPGGSEVRDCDGYYGAAISLDWDLDDDGSFETSGTSVPFSAATLDGPTTASAQARAQHPNDPSPFGTGDPVPVTVQVRNVAPAIASASVVDSLGRDLGGGVAKAIVGLPATLAVTFTDPGLADTQSGHVSWGDGVSDTAFDVFSSATNGATGALEDRHVFTSPGAYTIEATITDDDGDASSRELTVEVLSLEDAIQEVADELAELIAAATDPRVASALRSARDELIGNLGGTPPKNGALDRLQADDPVSAITKLRAAIEDLSTAESRGAGDLTVLKDLLGLVAEGIATVAYHEAETAVAPPSTGEAKALATIAALIGKGHDQLTAGQYLAACDSFRQATGKAVSLT
jgi:hypothetical protein